MPQRRSRRYAGACGRDPFRQFVSTENDHPSALDQLMDKNVATALVDRLLHHAHIVLTDGESVRLAEATSGQEVVRLGG